MPLKAELDSFVRFIDEELVKRNINTLIIQVEYRFQYQSHPELADSTALSAADAKRIVSVCRKNKIRIIPSINLLGHQSWANRVNKLLLVYPQFDETPWVVMPQKYEWPNPENLYCKSYCPLHPDLHPILFSLIDEICGVFEADAFHGGMDEVFYLGEDRCVRCAGKSKAALFAGEVQKIRDHLAGQGRELLIWGDRLIDGNATGLGIWESSNSGTHLAIDLIPKDVIICDWHYEKAGNTAAYFALKGFRVISSCWRKPEIALEQIKDMELFRQGKSVKEKKRYLGILQTTWVGLGLFLSTYYNPPPAEGQMQEETAARCFKVWTDAFISGKETQ